MSGEVSKNSGDHGEKLVERLFKELFGFPAYRSNIKIGCESKKEHSDLRLNSKSNSHGIDGLIHYNSTLKSELLEIGYISVKHTKDKYPGSPRNKFKQHFIDLATGLECFNYTDVKKDIEKNSVSVRNTRVTGVLFWLSNSASEEESIIEDIAKSQLESLNIGFDRIIFVDSARLQFIYSSILTVSNVSSKNYSFVYPSTGLNLDANYNQNFGDIMPLDFFAYDLLPLRFMVNEKVYFLISCRENIDEEHLAKIISLAKTFDKLEGTSSIFIAFKDYNSFNHDDLIQKVKSRFSDNSFIKLIKIISLEYDFKNLTNIN